MTFAGFPSSGRATAIPSVFFSDVLPQLADDPAVVGVALYAFNALMAKRGFPRELTVEELLADAGLAAYLKRSGCVSGEDAAETSRVVAGGLGRCVDAGVLLALIEESGDGEREVYFLNTPSDRRAMETAPRSDTSRLGNSLAANSDAEYTDAPASLTTIFCIFASGSSLSRSPASLSVSREAVPLPMAMSCTPCARHNLRSEFSD